MTHATVKAAVAAAGFGLFLGGCATTVDMGGPLGHYRYHYDSRPTVYQPAAVGETPAVVYRHPALVYYHDDD